MDLLIERAAARVRGAATARGAAMLLVLATSAAGAAADDEAPSAVPYRPSVSTPAALSAPGWLDVEAGFLHQHDGGSRRDSLPFTLKLAFTPDWGVRVGSDGWVRRLDESGERVSGFGDTAFVVKRRFEVDDESAFGLEGAAIGGRAHRSPSAASCCRARSTISRSGWSAVRGQARRRRWYTTARPSAAAAMITPGRSHTTAPTPRLVGRRRIHWP